MVSTHFYLSSTFLSPFKTPFSSRYPLPVLHSSLLPSLKIYSLFISILGLKRVKGEINQESPSDIQCSSCSVRSTTLKDLGLSRLPMQVNPPQHLKSHFSPKTSASLPSPHLHIPILILLVVVMDVQIMHLSPET